MWDVVVIGSGPAGYVAAIKAAQLGLKVACVEKEKALGGTCLNVGCIPSKALLHATELLYHVQKEGNILGLEPPKTLNLETLTQKKQAAIEKLTGGIAYLFKKNGVERIVGEGIIENPTTVRVGTTTLTTRYIVIATGSEPIPLPGLPFDETTLLSSTGALALKTIPKTMLIVGAGVIGLELGSVYRRLGTEITVIEATSRIIPEFDEDLATAFQRVLETQGFTFHLNTKITSGRGGHPTSRGDHLLRRRLSCRYRAQTCDQGAPCCPHRKRVYQNR